MSLVKATSMPMQMLVAHENKWKCVICGVSTVAQRFTYTICTIGHRNSHHGNPRMHLVVPITGSQFTVEFHLPLLAIIWKGESEYAADT
jgi:hypothetical protein